MAENENIEVFRLDTSHLLADLEKVRAESKKTQAEAEKAATGIVDAYSDVVSSIDKSQAATKKLTDTIKDADKASVDLGKDVKSATKDIESGANIAAKSMGNVAAETRKTSEAGKLLGDTLINALEAIGINVRPLIGLFNALRGAVDNNTKSTTLMATATTGATKAIGLTSVALRVLRVALISTGIGAIVVALGSLAAALFTTQRGTDALNRVLVPLKTIAQTLLGLFQDLGFAIIDTFKDPKQAVTDLWEFIKSQVVNRVIALPKLFGAIGKSIAEAFRFNWEGVKEAGIEATQAVAQFYTGLDSEQQNKLLEKTAGLIKKVGGEINRATEDAARLNQIQISLENLAIERAKNEGRLKREYEEQVDIVGDINKSFAERQKAGEEAIKLQEQLAAFEKQENELLIEQSKIKNAQNDTDRVAEAEYQKLVSNRDEIEAKHLETVRDVRKKINAIIRLQDAVEKELQEQRIKRENAINQQLLNDRVALIDELTNLNLTIDDANLNDYVKQIEDLKNKVQEKVNQAELKLKISLDPTGVDELIQEIPAIVEQIEEPLLGINERFNESYEAIAKRAVEIFIAGKDAGITQQQAYEQAVKESENRITQYRAAAAATALGAAQTVFNALGNLLGEQAKENKDFALFMIALNTATGVASAVAQGAAAGPPPANLVAIAAGIAAVLSGIAQAKQVLSSAQGFEHGTDYVKPKNSKQGKRVDDIPAWLTEGEGVATVKANTTYPGLVKAMNSNRVAEWFSQNMSTTNISNSNYVTNSTNNSGGSFSDLGMISELRKNRRLQEETNYILLKVAQNKRFKRAG